MTGVHMAAEMQEQPGILAALAARRGEIAARVRAVRPDSQYGTVLVGLPVVTEQERTLSAVVESA